MIFDEARWIFADTKSESGCPLFEKKFSVSKKAQAAEMFVTSVGIYNLFVNGTRIGDALFAPGFTSYHHRLQYQHYDITEQIVQGENTVGIHCANGWAVGYLGRGNTNHVFFDCILACGVIRIEYADGTSEQLVTDSTWDASLSGILKSEFYHGETVDYSAVKQSLGKAGEAPPPNTSLIPDEGVPVREQERISPVSLIVTPKGERVIDFGQNLAGYTEIRVKGNRGDRIRLTHAEVLDRDGNFYNANLELAKCENLYILSGGYDICKPSFSFQGYRYIRLDEYPFESVDLSSFTSVAIYSDMECTGTFECGQEAVNRLYQNTLWGQRSNFIDIPTDCPQRDERVGWTGDAQVFIRTAAIHYNISRFMQKWLKDMMLEQRADGAVESVVPAIPNRGSKIAAGWGDAAVICPWELYLAYGEAELLRTCYPMMEKWVEYVRKQGPEEYLWLGGDHYGDWLAFDIPLSPEVRQGATQTDLIASAFFAHSVDILKEAGRQIGKDVREYEDLSVSIRRAFHRTFMRDGLPVLYPAFDGLSANRAVQGLTQTAIVLILQFRLYQDDRERKMLTAKLVELIRGNGNRMTTGFLGTPYLLHALTDNGYSGVAYDLFLQEQCPSWLFPVHQGATTVWEHWDGIREDGSFWADCKNSFNHYAYGSVFDWVYGKVIGVEVPANGAGYRNVQITPYPDPRLGFAKGSIRTKFGILHSEWRYTGSEIHFFIVVPDGVKARICLPDGRMLNCSGGEHAFICKSTD